MRKYTTPHLDIGICLISLQRLRTLQKSGLCYLLEFCAVKSCATAAVQLLFLDQLPVSLARATLSRFLDLLHHCQKVHSASRPRSQRLRLLPCHPPCTLSCAGFLFHLVHPCSHHRRCRRPRHLSVQALVLEQLHQMT